MQIMFEVSENNIKILDILFSEKLHKPSLNMTTLAGGFLVTNYHEAGCKVSKSSLDQGRKQKRPLRQTAVDTWHG